AKFPWLLLRRGAEEGALPLPLQPHPRNLRLRQAGLIALLPAIILGDKAGSICKLLPSLPHGNQGTFLLWTNRGHSSCGMTSPEPSVDLLGPRGLICALWVP